MKPQNDIQRLVRNRDEIIKEIKKLQRRYIRVTNLIKEHDLSDLIKKGR